MDKLIIEEAPVIPLFYDKVARFTLKNIEGLGINPLNMVNLKKVKKISYIRKISITRYKNNRNDMLFQLFLSEIEITSNVSIENIFFS